MNFWGFTPAVFGGLGGGAAGVPCGRGSDPKAEFYLPAAVSGLVARGRRPWRSFPARRNGSASPTGGPARGWPRRSGRLSPGARTRPGFSLGGR